MKLHNPAEGAVLDFDPFNFRSALDPSHNLGGLVELNDYRAFRYGRAGAANTSKGKLEIAPAPKANHSNNTVAAAAAGAFSVSVTPGATAVVASEYDEGMASINAGPGAGQDYLISHNPAANASIAFTLTLSDPIAVALTSSSKLTLVHNTWNSFVEAAAATRRPAGVGLVDLTATYYGWLQTKGISSTLADGAIAVGNDLIASTSVAGAVKVVDTTSAATANAQYKVGSAAIIATVDTEYRPILLSID